MRPGFDRGYVPHPGLGEAFDETLPSPVPSGSQGGPTQPRGEPPPLAPPCSSRDRSRVRFGVLRFGSARFGCPPGSASPCAVPSPIVPRCCLSLCPRWMRRRCALLDRVSGRVAGEYVLGGHGGQRHHGHPRGRAGSGGLRQPRRHRTLPGAERTACSNTTGSPRGLSPPGFLCGTLP